MPRLTLRTLLAYIDDTLEPDQARALGRKVAESDEAKHLIERIKKVTRRRGLRTPVPDGSEDDVADPNTVAAFLSDNLDSEQLKQIEATCLDSDVHLAEVAACHQILTIVLTEPVRVPPTANQRMYNLVSPPAADLNRKPGRTIPVGGVSPPAFDQADADDPDAALLLGMRRYSAADSWSGRLKLVGALAGIGLFLVLAVLMALPHSSAEPPEISRGTTVALATTQNASEVSPTPITPITSTGSGSTTPSTSSGPSKTTDASTATPKPPPDSPKKELEVAPPPKVETDPGPGLGDKKVLPPLPGRDQVGKMEQPNVIVLTQDPAPGSPWLRVDPANSAVTASSVVMALPGYKADVKLATGVVVQLWGNVPEQVISEKTKVMQSRVRFHPAPMGFDADVTLEGGRIYLTTTKSTGAKIRVRIATEAWDIELPNDKADVLVQSNAAFIPGTRYPVGGMGGELPRIEALMVVVRGTANFDAPSRYKKFSVAVKNEIDWDSKTNNLSAPTAVNDQAVFPDRLPPILGSNGEEIQHYLSDTASALKDRNGIRTILEERMNYEKLPKFDLPRMLATYGYASLLDGVDDDEAKNMIANLYDMLVDSDRVAVRRAAVTAVSAWLQRSLKATPLFVSVLTDKKLVPPEDANLMAQLLRGYSAATFGPTAWDESKLDDLVGFLDSKWILIREAALGNLIGYYSIPAEVAGAVKPPAPIVNVGSKDEGYELFVKAWEARAVEIKKWMSMKKMEKK